MALYRAQVILPYFTNLPEDVIVNQFHFEATPTDVDVVGPEILDALAAFYGTAYGSSGAARVNYVDWTLAYIKVFALADPTPRIPWTSPPLGLTAGTLASPIPTEVACVLSFHAAAESGVRFQRLYNRVYLGAISPSAMFSSAVDDYPRFNTTFIGQVRTAAINLLADGAISGAQWVQVSNATGSSVIRPITGGWVDNGPDTQRRRSVLATSRNSWTPAA